MSILRPGIATAVAAATERTAGAVRVHAVQVAGRAVGWTVGWTVGWSVGWAPRSGRSLRRRACEHTFALTSDGNPYARFRRALETGNETLVVAAARELPQVSLDDALRICLVLRGSDPSRYERAAVRWLGRFALEAREVTINDLRLAAGALDALPEHPSEAMELLQRLCVARGVG